MPHRDEQWTGELGEARRRDVVASYPLDDIRLREQLDRLAGLAAAICEAPVGLVSLVSGDRQIFAGRSGTDLTQTPVEQSFCAHAMYRDEAMEVLDASVDPRFAHNPLVTGAPHIRFYAGQPLKSPEGAPLGSFCIIDDKPRPPLSPSQRQALDSLSTSVMALLDRWRTDQVTLEREAGAKVRAAEFEQRFLILSDAMPQMVWTARADGHRDYSNRRWCRFTGADEEMSHGSGWLDFVHPQDRRIARVAWERAIAAQDGYEVEYRLRASDGEHRWVLARALPMRDECGVVTRWIGTSTDIQEQKQTAEALEVISQELSHRIKNIFAVISGLISMSVRNSPELAAVGADLQNRVLALGRAHNFVRPHSRQSQSRDAYDSLRGMLTSLLEAYLQGDDRIAIIGPDVIIDDRSATPLALAFHELATNAAKYGALATREGRVVISLSDPADDDGELTLTWQEFGGPAVGFPAGIGFGHKLIDLSICRQLGGTVSYDWQPGGLRVTAELNRASLVRRNAGALRRV